jgi:16S rRNA (uracil1498-N3)-methyltransferase
VPGAEATLASSLPAALGGSIAFAIGPEGGLTDAEIASATARGFRPVSIGPFVLRTETVAAAVLGAVRVLS